MNAGGWCPRCEKMICGCEWRLRYSPAPPRMRPGFVEALETERDGYRAVLESIADPTVRKIPHNPTKSDLLHAIRDLRKRALRAIHAADGTTTP